MEWGDEGTEWECKLKSKMIDLGNTSLKTREYQAQNATDLRIIPVLTIQMRIIPALT